MNINQLYNAIEDPARIDTLETGELEALLDHYPYFPAAHLLLTKAYKNRNDHRFSDQLHQASVYTGSRRLLHQLVDTTPEEVAPKPAITIHLDQPLPDLPQAAAVSPLTPQQEFLPPPAQEEQEIPVPIDLQGADRDPATEVSQPAEEVLREEAADPVTLGTTESNPTAALAGFDEMSQSILVQAVQSSIEQEVSDDAAEFRMSTPPKPMFTEKEEGPVAEKWSFEDWMMRRAEEMNYGEKDGIDPPLDTSFDDSVPSIAHGRTRIYADRKDQQRNLIDRFIQNEPKITPGKADEYSSHTDLARASLEDDMTMVTETMARVYEFQGRLDKARNIYRKLIELHPEKSIYFAALLKNLEKTKK